MSLESMNCQTRYLILIVLTFTLLTSGKPEKRKRTELTPWGKETFNEFIFPNKAYNIIQFGAKTDLSFNNQQAIQSAINECHANGGGKVIVPKGKWLTGYLELKSNVNLHLNEEATLLFSNDIDTYRVPTFTRWEGIECVNYHPLIYARNAKNISITGKGIIDGNGKDWWAFAKVNQRITLSKLYDQVLAGVLPEERNCLDYEGGSYLRPSMIQFISCENIYMKDVELRSGPMWTNHFIYCENVVAENIRVITEGTNNDGFVVDSSSKILISNCFFSTGDDCIVLKSGLNEDGWRVNRPSERIIIKNCSTHKGNGGVVIGSEMSGGVKKVYAHNCVFNKTSRGLRIKTMKGRGGIIEDIWFENITLDSIYNEAVIITMDYGSSSIAPRNDSLPLIRNIHYKNVISTNSRLTLNVIGLPNQKIESVFFDNCSFSGRRGIQINNAQYIHFNNLTIESIQTEPVAISGSSNIFLNKVKVTHSSQYNR